MSPPVESRHTDDFPPKSPKSGTIKWKYPHFCCVNVAWALSAVRILSCVVPVQAVPPASGHVTDPPLRLQTSGV